jgi:predicted nucleotidyltransferase
MLFVFTISHCNKLPDFSLTKGKITQMTVLFYTTQSDLAAEQLQNVIELLVLKDQLEMCRTFDSLSRRLCRPSNHLDIAVLAAANGEDLLKILSLRDLLSDIRIILILPNGKPETISKAHSLGPRFLTYLDSNVEDLQGVLSKMLDNATYP